VGFYRVVDDGHISYMAVININPEDLEGTANEMPPGIPVTLIPGLPGNRVQGDPYWFRTITANGVILLPFGKRNPAYRLSVFPTVSSRGC